MKPVLAAALAAPLMLIGPGVRAHDAGEWNGRLGLHQVQPRNDNHAIVDVSRDTGVTGGLSYFLTSTLAADLLLAIPFEHRVNLKPDGARVGSAQHLPPTLSLVWYPDLGGPVQPFMGLGLNYTTFFQEKTQGALEGQKLHLGDSWGLAFNAGTEFRLSPEFSLVIDARYLDLDTRARLDHTSLGTLHIDPWCYGASLAFRF